ncbi:MAG: c-type cytochrome [Woeseiaceae bacterium]|nr:c-type cytochrome [Woeseiaceae bacterium]MDX2607315.1 c-type cytochrome [Woeseiaceae bacterium]
MRKHRSAVLVGGLLALLGSSIALAQVAALTDEDSAAAAADYQKYCALCHGDDRQGHVNDHAPSLKSKSLLSTAYRWHLWFPTAYGRHGTPMAGFFEEVGGPMTKDEILNVLAWLKEQVDVEKVELSRDPVIGDISLGAQVYARECAECHGANGEGVTGTALGNAAMLSLTMDSFLRYAIQNGRDGTDMPAFAEKLSENEIDSVTAFLRSRASGWALEKPVYRSPPAKEDYILNPGAQVPDFELKDDLYVMSADLDKALRDGRRLVLLDTRVMALWQMANIEGSVPLPYYYDGVDKLFDDLPTDGTLIVTYCECPRAAAESVSRKLRARGITNTAVLWEGIQGWISLGYPVSRGETVAVKVEDVRSLDH